MTELIVPQDNMIGASVLISIDQFRDRIVGIVESAVPHIASRSAEGAVELHRCRSQMSRVLSIYNLFIGREILDPMIRDGHATVSRDASVIKEDCATLVHDYQRFSSRWRDENVLVHWKKYQPEAAAFVRRILLHVETVIKLLGHAIKPLPAHLALRLQKL